MEEVPFEFFECFIVVGCSLNKSKESLEYDYEFTYAL